MNLESLEKDLANEGFCFIEQQTRLRLPKKGSELNPQYDFYVSRVNVYNLLIESLTKEIEYLMKR